MGLMARFCRPEEAINPVAIFGYQTTWIIPSFPIYTIKIVAMGIVKPWRANLTVTLNFWSNDEVVKGTSHQLGDIVILRRMHGILFNWVLSASLEDHYFMTSGMAWIGGFCDISTLSLPPLKSTRSIIIYDIRYTLIWPSSNMTSN